MITIDGSQGEGGGQILRSAVALAGVLGVPVRIERIRARRPKPGLQRQHLMAVQAAARACNGQIDGAELHSQRIVLHPQAPCAGELHVDIGSAGSTTLVAQTLLPILLAADGPSTAVIRGGTHNPLAPTVEFLGESLLPLLHGIGISATIALDRHGFYPAGGGCIRMQVQPGQASAPLRLLERGKNLGRHAEAIIANLPAHVASREAMALKHALHWSHAEVDEREVRAAGPGNAFIARLRFANVVAVFSAIGDIKKRAEQVAGEVVHAITDYLAADAPVCEHVADQLLLPMALGAGGEFRAVAISEHTRTNAAIIDRFLPGAVAVDEAARMVRVRGR